MYIHAQTHTPSHTHTVIIFVLRTNTTDVLLVLLSAENNFITFSLQLLYLPFHFRFLQRKC